MIKAKYLAMPVLALSLLAVPALADHHKDDKGPRGEHMHEKMMERFDTDGNGEISMQEFQTAHAKKFAEIDTDGNGSLSVEEMKAHHSEMKDKWKEKKERFKAMKEKSEGDPETSVE